MEVYDIAMLIVLFGAMVFGAIKGFAWQLASIASIVLSYLVAYKYREPFSESIQAEPPWNRFLAMLILFVGTSLVIWVAFRMIRGTIDRLKLREFDRQIGALFGLAKGALYCILITFFAVTLCGDQIGEAIIRSKSGRYISQVLDRSEAVIPEEIHDVVQPYLDKFENSMREAKPSLLNRVPWLAEEETAPIEQATQWQPSQPFNSAGESTLPIDPSPWLPSNQNLAPQQPQQAQQPVWDGYQR